MASKSIRRRLNLFDLNSKLESELRSHGIPFTQFNYPDFHDFHFPMSIPSDYEILPIKKCQQASNRKKTIVCAFENDDELYASIHNLDKLIDKLRHEYYGACGFDLTVSADMEPSEQSAYLLANMLITGYMLVKGVRVIPNWRTGDAATTVALRSYPQHICFAAGTLGCAQYDIAHGKAETLHKLYLTRPSFLAIYGPLLKEYAAVLNYWQQPYHVWPDFRRRSYDRSQNKGGAK